MKVALLAAMLLAVPAARLGAQTPIAYDVDQLPVTHGIVLQYSLTPRGDVDGLILADGTEVHLPPHLGPQLVSAVKPGASVTIHGLRARAIPMIQALSVTNDANGATVTDTGPGTPPDPRAQDQSLTARGQVKTQLHGPQGELNGVLLQDGTIIRLPPPEAQRLAAWLKPGAPIYVKGEGYAGRLGRVIGADIIGPSPNDVIPIPSPGPSAMTMTGPRNDGSAAPAGSPPGPPQPSLPRSPPVDPTPLPAR